MKTEEREAWLDERKMGIGGSDLAAILGISKWRTPLDVYLDKIGVVVADEDDAKRLTFARGQALEPLVVSEYVRTTGKLVDVSPTLHEGCLLANVDRVILDDSGAVEGILECKTSRELSPWDEVPAYYQTQVLHYLGFFPGVQYADVAVLFANDQFKIYRVQRDSGMIQNLRAFASNWWHNHVEKRVPPNAQTMGDVKYLYPRSESVRLEDTTGDLFAAVQEIRFLKEEIARLEGRVECKKAAICERMGRADTLAYKGQVIATYKSRKDSLKTDWKAVASHFSPSEALVAEHTKTIAGGRTFLMK